MPYSWKEVAEAWCIPLDDFLGTRDAKLADFDPFERLKKENQSFSIDQFAAVKLLGAPELTLHLLKSSVPHVRLTAVLLNDGCRAGFVARRQEGCDLVSLAPELRGNGLSAEMLLATRVLRASRKFSDVPDLRHASKQLFCGGSYSVAGLASARAAHQLAVIRGLARGNAIPPEVLADYPQVMQSRHRKKPPDYPPDVFAASRWSNFHRIFRARGRVRVPVACRRLSRVRFRPARPSLACSPADSWRWHIATRPLARARPFDEQARPLSCACAHRAGRDRRRDPRRNGSGGPACRRPSAASV